MLSGKHIYHKSVFKNTLITLFRYNSFPLCNLKYCIYAFKSIILRRSPEASADCQRKPCARRLGSSMSSALIHWVLTSNLGDGYYHLCPPSLYTGVQWGKRGMSKLPKVTQLVVGLRFESRQSEPRAHALLSQYPILYYLRCVIIPILQVRKTVLFLKAEGDGCCE